MPMAPRCRGSSTRTTSRSTTRYGIMGDGATHRQADDHQVLSRRHRAVQRARGRQRVALSDAERVSERRRNGTPSFVDAASGDYRLIPGSSGGVRRLFGGDPWRRRRQAERTPIAGEPIADAAADRAATVEPAAGGGCRRSVHGDRRRADVGRRHRVAPIPTARCSITCGTGATRCWCARPICRLPRSAAPSGSATSQADAAGGAMLLNPDKGAAKRAAALASPGSYVEFTVNAAAGVPYYLWLRMRASNNAYCERLALRAVQRRGRCARAPRWPASVPPTACR